MDNAIELVLSNQMTCAEAARCFKIPYPTLYYAYRVTLSKLSGKPKSREQTKQIKPHEPTKQSEKAGKIRKKSWTQKNMDRAVKLILTNKMNCFQAARRCKVPYPTLYYAYKAALATKSEKAKPKQRNQVVKSNQPKQTEKSKKQKRRISWTHKDVETAIEIVLSKQMSCSQAARHYNLPYPTLYYSYKGALLKQSTKDESSEECNQPESEQSETTGKSKTVAQKNMEDAMEMVLSKQMSCNRAAHHFKVSYQILYHSTKARLCNQSEIAKQSKPEPKQTERSKKGKRSKRKKWTPKNMEKAIELVVSKKATFIKAARLFKIPCSTLYYYYQTTVPKQDEKSKSSEQVEQSEKVKSPEQDEQSEHGEQSDRDEQSKQDGKFGHGEQSERNHQSEQDEQFGRGEQSERDDQSKQDEQFGHDEQPERDDQSKQDEQLGQGGGQSEEHNQAEQAEQPKQLEKPEGNVMVLQNIKIDKIYSKGREIVDIQDIDFSIDM